MKQYITYATKLESCGTLGCRPGNMIDKYTSKRCNNRRVPESWGVRISQSLISAITIGIVAAGLTMNSARASTIFESATLGPLAQSGFTLSATQWLAAEFSLTSTKTITGIGGHIGGNDLFGAIIELPFANALLSFLPSQFESNAIAHTVINGGILSSDRLAPISATLGAGDYAVVFGSGLFGTAGNGLMARNNPDLFNSSMFFSSLKSGPPAEDQWRSFSSLDPSTTLRFVVEGGSDAVSAVPLPAALPLFLSGLTGIVFLRRRRRKA